MFQVQITIKKFNITNKKGKLANKSEVLIDYGTGYYVERNLNEASKFCDRKL